MRPVDTGNRNYFQNRSEEDIMRTFLKSSFVWQFGTGFVLGAIGLVALQPVEGRQAFIDHVTPTALVQR